MKLKATLLILVFFITFILGGCATHTPPPPCDRYASVGYTVGSPHYVDCGPAKPINQVAAISSVGNPNKY